MVEFRIKINQKQKSAYIPRALVQVLGYALKATPNRAAVLVYPENSEIEDVIKSLGLIKKDLEHGQELQKKDRIGA